MVDVETSIVIDKPLDQVFPWVRDEANMPQWNKDLLKVEKTTPGPVGKGTRYRLEIVPFMGTKGGEGEVIGYEENRLIELQFHMGPMSPHVFHRFEPAGTGTRFTRHIQIQPSGMMKLMAPMMKVVLGKKNAQHLANLKRLLEA